MPGLPDVSLTAFGVAAARASETTRMDRLFSDPFAEAFVRAAGPTHGAERERPRALLDWISVRTRFLDDLLLNSCAAGAWQVVIFGAGLDARAFRLAWPSEVRLFELDLPGLLEFKEDVIRSEGWQPSCERICVPVDLSGDWSEPLLGAGFTAGSLVAFSAEGLLAYLSASTSDSLVARAAELSSPGSRLGLTLASSRRLETWREAHPEPSASASDYVSLWRSANAEHAIEWLASRGWHARAFDVAERSATYGRPLEEVSERASGARLVDAERR